MEAEIIRDVIVSIVTAALIAYVAHRLRQPVILDYILAGIVIGPQQGSGG